MRASSYPQQDPITKQELKQAWGDWLSSLANWEWFVTLTLRGTKHLGERGTWTKPVN